MASTTTNGAGPNSTTPSTTPTEISFPLPRSPNTQVHLHLTNTPISLLLFLTTTTNSPSVALPSPLGSFVYAMSSRTNPKEILTTPLYMLESSLESATRIARLLVRKTGKPVYVGSSISFKGGGMGGTVEEEMEGFGRIVEVIMNAIDGTGEGYGRNGS